MTVQDPSFNDGRATVIPSLWIKDGKPYQARDEREAIALARASQVPFKGYSNIQQADRASVDREKQWQKVTPETSGQVAPLWETSPFAPASSSSYFYRDPNAPGAEPGQHFGPMAHELEQTPAGRSVVTIMPNGQKGIDTGRLALLNASETGQLRREVDALKAGTPKVPTARFADVGYADKAAALKRKNDEQEAMLRQLTAASDVSAFNAPTAYPAPVAFTGY